MFQEKILKTEKRRQQVIFALWLTGFFFLPLIWWQNFFLFHSYWNKSEYPKARFYVRFSFWAALLLSIIIITWMIVYFVIYPRGSDGFRAFTILNYAWIFDYI
ncbi:hypothetical protein BLNAU_170 [Blattamonas nauphoetae]|uniref:Gamma-secretase subunit PEN-2 n=1 Tax=Blattamonas nauphoetae TaxID=2049346 RepID=A0ABQ9YM82_9EUKA|nr:hypothetical protein BLNAU_170 [Blattamonas nauphoetae]